MLYTQSLGNYNFAKLRVGCIEVNIYSVAFAYCNGLCLIANKTEHQWAVAIGYVDVVPAALVGLGADSASFYFYGSARDRQFIVCAVNGTGNVAGGIAPECSEARDD